MKSSPSSSHDQLLDNPDYHLSPNQPIISIQYQPEKKVIKPFFFNDNVIVMVISGDWLKKKKKILTIMEYKKISNQ